ncbi:MAG: hypothetical protein EU542_04150 [Promethearchaeota archaeon]|nr:MAG: hypothetical protein EU542_04150 [Candidatus Lokiarchaeota archaeon]
MDEFLKKLQLSEDAIKIYNQSLGRHPLTYYELYSLLPSLSSEDFESVIKELVETDLLIEIMPQESEVLLHYLAVPPFTPILNYYTNINANLSNIEDAIFGLITNSLNQIFQDEEILNLESLYESFEEIKNDIIEDSLIQKQDAKEIYGEFENIKKIEENFTNLKQILSGTEKDDLSFLTKLNNLILNKITKLTENISKIKNVLIENIKDLELKKREPGVLEVIDNVFETVIKDMLMDFSSEMNEIVEKEFEIFDMLLDEEIIQPIKDKIESIIKSGSDLNILALNIISNSEKNVNQIHKLIKEDREDLQSELEKLKARILKVLNDIIRDSISQVSGLNEPIENIMKQFLEKNISSDRTIINDIWFIKSKTKIIEEIANLIANTKKQLTIIVPKLEDFLKIEQFEKIPEEIKIRLVSSDPHTNSLVKRFKDLNNLQFKNLKNENVVALKGDNKHVIISLIKQDSTDVLNDIVGIGVNYHPLISILSPIIETTWASAKSEEMKPLEKKPAPTPEIEKPPVKKELISDSSVKQKIKEEIKEITATPEKVSMPTGAHISQVKPSTGNQPDALINTSFNMLLSKLDVIKGEDFSKELENLADLILEKRGFSVTLHSIRQIINKFKDHENFLNDEEKNEIFESIETWKQRLFQ